jgi:hypothetical protein
MRLESTQPEQTLPVCVENARNLLVQALESGRIHITEHFRQRSRERKFTLVDAEKIIRDGALVGGPVYCPRFRNWRFRLTGLCCSQALEIRVGLTFELDLESPVMVLITGIPKGRVRSCKTNKSVSVLRL